MSCLYNQDKQQGLPVKGQLFRLNLQYDNSRTFRNYMLGIFLGNSSPRSVINLMFGINLGKRECTQIGITNSCFVKLNMNDYLELSYTIKTRNCMYNKKKKRFLQNGIAVKSYKFDKVPR